MILIFLSVFFVNTPSLLAWSFLVHYSLGRDKGYSHETAAFFNLPDLWPNMPEISGVPYWTTITDEFCWSHGLQRNGNTYVIADAIFGLSAVEPIPIPNEPNNPNDSREPGIVMKKLINDKVKWNNDSDKQLATKTATYFTGHNAADAVVHFSYFLAGSATNWFTNHKIKETWAEYAVMDQLGKITFTNGCITQFSNVSINPNDSSQTIIPMSVENIDPKIIILAQKVARKNRMALDKGDNPTRFTTISTIAGITTLINNCSSNANSFIRNMNQDSYNSFTEKAISNGWIQRQYDQLNSAFIYDYSTLMNKYNSALLAMP